MYLYQCSPHHTYGILVVQYEFSLMWELGGTKNFDMVAGSKLQTRHPPNTPYPSFGEDPACTYV